MTGSATSTSMAVTSPQILRFGVYEVDLRARELRRRGLRVKLQQKPFQLLEILLEQPGELVTRREVAERLWPGIHVSFDRSLNTAVNALRRALNDSPRNPRFLETRSGLGYRFIGALERVDAGEPASQSWPRIESIAVLPFMNISGSPAVDYLGSGVAASLTGMLASTESIRVISGAESLPLRVAGTDASAVGRQLNVDAVVTGRITQHAMLLAICAELMDVRSGRRLWVQRYERAESEASALAPEIAGDIVAEMHQRLEISVSGRSAATSEAYQDYLKGRYFQSKMTEDALRQSIAYFESALERDPRFALAYAGLADAYSLFGFLDLMRPRDALSRARELAISALRINGNLAEAHAAMAGVMRLYDWDKNGAEAEYRRALALNPNSACARHSYAAHLCCLGKFSEAMEQLKKAQELEPLSLTISNEIAWTHYIAGDFEAALQQAWKTLALEPRFAAAQHTLGLANQQLGEFEDAIVELRNACTCSGNHPAAQASLAGALAAKGETAEAVKLLNGLLDWSRERYISSYCIGTVYTALGDADNAFRRLECAMEERDVWMVWLPLDPRYRALRSDSRWGRLVGALTSLA